MTNDEIIDAIHFSCCCSIVKRTDMKAVKEQKPEDGKLVLTCIWHKLKNREMEPYQWRTLRYYAKSDKFKCPFQHTTQAPTHWTELPNWKGE